MINAVTNKFLTLSVTQLIKFRDVDYKYLWNFQWAAYSMKCSYVKTVKIKSKTVQDSKHFQVRALIVAVRLYTGKAVDVIGYSLGVPVSRKAYLNSLMISIQCVITNKKQAILGGNCVDTGEDLGGPLTKFIGIHLKDKQSKSSEAFSERHVFRYLYRSGR